MKPEYRQKLLAVLAHLDQLTTDADIILADPGDVENAALAEELRELLVDMRAEVEAKLEAGVSYYCQARCPVCQAQCKLHPNHPVGHACQHCGHTWIV